MNNPIPEWVQEIWDAWDIRVVVLFSLTLQIILFAFGRYRRRTTSVLITSTVWLSYLTADSVAIVALGKLSDILTEVNLGQIRIKPDDRLQALWAPMLLLHLGGPDTITAYSVKDSTLWIRHLLGLVVHFVGAVYVVFCSWDSSTWLSLLTIPTFIAGFIKYSERTLCLWFANRTKPANASITGEISKALEETTEGVQNIKWLAVAYLWYESLKPSTCDFIGKINLAPLIRISFDHKQENFVDNLFSIIEAELGFVYDELYTKSAMIYTGISCVLRAVGFIATIVVLVGFSVISKSGYSDPDVIITYVLLIAAVSLEAFAFYLMIWSDRGAIWLLKHRRLPLMAPILRCLGPFRINRKRWSRSVSQLNLLDYCAEKATWLDKILSIVGVEDMYKKHRCKKNIEKGDELQQIRKATFEGASKVLVQIDDLWKFDTKGEITLRGYDAIRDLDWVFEKQFDMFIICWHLATDICYNSCGTIKSEEKAVRQNAKFMSDYMMYLLATRPHMLRISVGNIAFKTVCKDLRDVYDKIKDKSFDAIRRLVNSAEHIVLTEPLKLAEFMMQNYGDHLWEIIGEVWAEIMCYGASNCQVSHHLEELIQGGEWLTHVWLLLTILGLTDKVNVERANLRAASRETVAPLVDHIFNHPFTSGGRSVGTMLEF